MILFALQGVRDSPREGGGQKRTFPRQSQQPGTESRGGGFPAAALQTAHHRGRINPAMTQYSIFYMMGKDTYNKDSLPDCLS